ncbi:tautomerase (plasmid) [Agrobacterium sp. 13-2099-1-2]|uniref:tautomerase family protein n=1 Tax=Agrobacterium sp. 13-2099-1-2 TaxID=1841651 RepID=UPI0009F673A9|nr:tautomerase [Agrobacterium sp. 13-2099-1-2]UZX45264.1 tautomerase [Agrobacterium sp. 13-2099-1-2]
MSWFSGKDAKAKKAVAAENTGTDPNYIYVIFEAVEPSDWSGAGKIFGEESA